MFDADELTATHIQGPHDLIEMRGTLVRKTNPLRTKILIFSTIYRQFDFSDRDWLTLKTQDLDGLLRHLFDACPTLDELDARLHRTARELDGVEENIDAADLLVRCFAPFYRSEEGEAPPPIEENTDVTEDSAAESDALPTLDEDISEDWSVAIPAEPTPQPDLEDEDEDSDSSLFFGMSADDSQSLPPAPIPSSPPPTPHPSSRLSDRLWQHLASSDEVQDLIRHASKDLTEAIAQSIADLELNLDVPCASFDSEEQVRIKHDAVKALLNNVRASLDRIGGLLDAQTPAVTTTPPVVTLQQQASQGQPKAIARWLESNFRHQGISVLATQKGQCLHVVLEFEGDRDPNFLGRMARENILKLNLTSAARVKVHGRPPGQKQPNWTRTFVL